MLIGMMCFAGLRAETPDLKENSTDTTYMISINEINMEIVSNVSIDQEFDFKESLLIDSVPIHQAMTVRYLQVDYSIKTVSSELHQFKKDRNPRDGIRC